MQLLRILGILLGMLVAAGFGLCGAWGVSLSLGSERAPTFVIVFGLLGLAICFGLGLVVWRQIQALRKGDTPPGP